MMRKRKEAPAPTAPVPERQFGETRDEHAARKLRFWRDWSAVEEFQRQSRLAGQPERLDGLVDPPTERAQHDPVEQLEQPIADDDGNVSLPSRAVDTLERMRRAGTITDEWHAAGMQFRQDFGFAHFESLRAADYGRIPGGGKAGTVGYAATEARERVASALEALGGHGSPTGTAAWYVLGVGLTIKEWSQRQRWGTGRALSPEAAAGVLIGALGVLDAHYTALAYASKLERQE
jgi:hypothetical protein